MVASATELRRSDRASVVLPILCDRSHEVNKLTGDESSVTITKV